MPVPPAATERIKEKKKTEKIMLWGWGRVEGILVQLTGTQQLLRGVKVDGQLTV